MYHGMMFTVFSVYAGRRNAARKHDILEKSVDIDKRIQAYKTEAFITFLAAGMMSGASLGGLAIAKNMQPGMPVTILLALMYAAVTAAEVALFSTLFTHGEIKFLERQDKKTTLAVVASGQKQHDYQIQGRISC